MIWSAVWTTLVLGAFVVLFLIGRRLWRSFKALTAEAGRSAEVMGRLNQLVADLDEQQARHGFGPHLAATEEQREHWRSTRAENVAARAERLRARRRRTLDRWRAIGMPL
ncbi:hypothetical protein IM660_09710 [Ruania alkalisoli]|uniref:Uncharacterized protein n=1 Tax=Ruania alkalisoli TaxID=2779775 RepID=A0A7M1SZN2_9MICO|nr:hypothetical protein [Ruania alkalisoli]QOR72467.1 hypothetical protein IM660_09710 [Ruania alkalisoli]